MLRPDVRKYTDYRAFLKDWALYCQSRNPRWSYGVWARKMGLSSKSSLVMVLNGKRNPGPRLVRCIVASLELNGKEASHFERLVAIHKANLGDFFRVTVERTENSTEAEIMEKNVSRWLMLVLRELATLPDFHESSQWLSSRLGAAISDEDFELALRTLLAEGVLERSSSGKPILATPRVPTPWRSSEVRRFHHEGMQAGVRAYETAPPALRSYHTSFLRVKLSRVADARALLQKFQRDLESLFDESLEAEAVYQLNLQLFPVTQMPNE
jgi:uncharacterized protein (TIGR02147 family)